MDFFDAVTLRANVKKFSKDDVDEKLIGVILWMGNHAESAGDTQAWEFIVVDEEAVKNRLHTAALKLDVVKEAPVSIVICADLKKLSTKYNERGEYVYSIQDTASVATLMIITANILGLAANWIRAFDESMVKETLALPDNMRPLGIITIGYPAETVEKRMFANHENLTWLNQYRRKSNQSYLFQPGPKEEVFTPIVNQILEKLKKKSNVNK